MPDVHVVKQTDILPRDRLTVSRSTAMLAPTSTMAPVSRVVLVPFLRRTPVNVPSVLPTHSAKVARGSVTSVPMDTDAALDLPSASDNDLWVYNLMIVCVFDYISLSRLFCHF